MPGPSTGGLPCVPGLACGQGGIGKGEKPSGHGELIGQSREARKQRCASCRLPRPVSHQAAVQRPQVVVGIVKRGFDGACGRPGDMNRPCASATANIPAVAKKGVKVGYRAISRSSLFPSFPSRVIPLLR